MLLGQRWCILQLDDLAVDACAAVAVVASFFKELSVLAFAVLHDWGKQCDHGAWR